MPQAKIIFITGGVISSLGKGLCGSSLALLLKRRGLKIKQIKMDPYLNVDPGTMSPFQHGEVFVTEDGAETDLDLGNYERFTDQCLSAEQNITSGQIYERVIAKERKGEYLGGTVQVIPHITNEIKERISKVSKGSDVTIVEVGGTVGDIESLPFLEAIRQLRFDLGDKNVCYVHVTLVPYISTAGEMKTKPTQHSVQELRRIGIQPDIILCRADRDFSDDIKDKIALFANMCPNQVIKGLNVDSIYKVPLELYKEGLSDKVCKRLSIKSKAPQLKSWKEFIRKLDNPKREVNIAMVGKYVDYSDSYSSLNESLLHAAVFHQAKLNIHYINSEIFEKKSNLSMKAREKILGSCDAILIPGGFGKRGVLGMIYAAEYARVNNVPYFGICLGMHIAAIEFARNVLGKPKADSAEFTKKGDLVIDYMYGQKKAQKGGTMRLGAYDCNLKAKSLAQKAYQKKSISERHRHRLEFQNKYKKAMEKKGVVFSGVNPQQNLVEIMELAEHPWFLACQFHPEFKSRPEKAHPLFKDFIKAALNRQ